MRLSALSANAMAVASSACCTSVGFSRRGTSVEGVRLDPPIFENRPVAMLKPPHHKGVCAVKVVTVAAPVAKLAEPVHAVGLQVDGGSVGAVVGVGVAAQEESGKLN